MHEPMSKIQSENMACLAIRRCTVIQSLPYSLAAIALFLLLGFSRVWQRRRHQRVISSRLLMSDTQKLEILEEGSSSNQSQNQERPLGAEEQSHISPILSELADLEAYFAGILQLGVTSGQVAAMVQEKRKKEDSNISKIRGETNPKISHQSSSPVSPGPDDSMRNLRFTESDQIEYYHDSDLNEIWRRRLLTFVGQRTLL